MPSFQDHDGNRQSSAPISYLAGENTTDDRIYGGAAPASKAAATATGTVVTGACKYYGYIVTTIIGAGTVVIYDNTSAAGTVIDHIPAATAAGTRGVLAAPVPCSLGVHGVFASTGTVLFLYT